MKLDEIKVLVNVLENSNLSYLEVSEGQFQLKLGKNGGAAADAERVETVSAAVPAPAKSEVVVVEEAQPTVTGGSAVKSPMVGVFYAAPSPEAEPFVREGQTVKQGQVLCIIEAMKLMNEITAEKDGVVNRLCVKNGDIVEFGQPLFYIQ